MQQAVVVEAVPWLEVVGRMEVAGEALWLQEGRMEVVEEVVQLLQSQPWQPLE